MYRSSDSFVNKHDKLCYSLSELNRTASSGLLERHYGSASVSQDPNDYQTLEVEMGMFDSRSSKAKSVACLRGLVEEEGEGGVAMLPPQIPNWVLLRPSSAERSEDSSNRQSSRKQKARSMDELAPQRPKRVVRFEDESDLHPSNTLPRAHHKSGVGIRTSSHCSDTSVVSNLKVVNSMPQVGSEESDSHSPSQSSLMWCRSVDDTLDAIPEDGTLLDDDTHQLETSMSSRELRSLNSTNDEMNVTMETVAMATSSSQLEDEARHSATSATNSCSSLLQPVPSSTGQDGTEINQSSKGPSSEEDNISDLQDGTQTSAPKEPFVECQEEDNIAEDTYQDMLAAEEEESEVSSVSQTSMERTPPLKIKVSFTIIEEAERKVIKDHPTSPLRLGGEPAEHKPVASSPLHNEGMATNQYTTSHTGRMGANLPLNTSLSVGEDSGHHGNQSADSEGEATSTRVHFIKEIFLKQSKTEDNHAKKLKPPGMSQQRRKSREMLSKRWPQLLEEEERRRVVEDNDLLLCASVPTLDLANSETDLQSSSETNLQSGGRAKVYSGSEGFADGQQPPWLPAIAVDSDRKDEVEEVDWFSGVVTETLQFQMDKQDEAIPEIGGSHFQLVYHSNSDDSTSDSTDDSDDDEFVQPTVVSGSDLASKTPPPRYPTLRSILNHAQMYLPTSGESPGSSRDLLASSMMPLDYPKVSRKPRMSIIKEEEEAIEELIRII